MDKIKRAVLIIIFSSMFQVGCGASEINDLPVAEIISRSSAQMTELESFEFLIERSGAPAFLNVEEAISFRRAEGNYISPNHVQASVRVISPGLVTEVDVIRIGDEQWETNLLSGNWQVSDPRYSFNLSLLFDPTVGIQAIINQDMVSSELIGFEELPEIPGKELYVIEAVLNGEGANRMSYGLIDNDTLQVKMWVDPNNFYLHRITMVDPGGEEDTVWLIDFWHFGETFNIEKPILSNE